MNFEFSGTTINFMSKGLLLLFLLISSIIDIRTRLVFDFIILAGFAAGLPFLYLNHDLTPLMGILGALVGGGVLFLLGFITKGGVGQGDAKVIAVCGLFLGLEKVIGLLFAATVLCGAAGLILLAVDRKNRKKEIPFIPFVFTAALLVIFI